MPAGKLATSVRVTDEGGRHVVIAAGDDVPAWARSDAQRLIDRGALRGNERGELDLSPDMLRTLIVCQRMVDQAKET